MGSHRAACLVSCLILAQVERAGGWGSGSLRLGAEMGEGPGLALTLTRHSTDLSPSSLTLEKKTFLTQDRWLTKVPSRYLPLPSCAPHPATTTNKY